MGKRSILFKMSYFFDSFRLFINTKWYFLRYCYIFTKDCSKKVRIRPKVRFNPFRSDQLRVKLHDGVYIERNTTFQGTGLIEIGNNSSIGEFTTIGSSKKVVIGNYVQIASGCSIRDTNHIIPSDHNQLIVNSGIEAKEVIIEDDCWIAANVSILSGVKIGKGSVVAAGAVVTKDVPPYTIVGGVPAKVIKKRGE